MYGIVVSRQGLVPYLAPIYRGAISRRCLVLSVTMFTQKETDIIIWTIVLLNFMRCRLYLLLNSFLYFKSRNLGLGSFDRASLAKCEEREKIKNMQQLDAYK